MTDFGVEVEPEGGLTDKTIPLSWGKARQLLKDAGVSVGTSVDPTAALRPVSSGQCKALFKRLGKLRIVTWAYGTDEEIAAMVAAADAGQINLADYWTVGDTRKVKLAAVSDTGFEMFIDAQKVELVLMNVGGKTLSNGKECSFVVGQKNSLATFGSMNIANTNSGGWDECNRRTWCNNIYRSAIPASLRGIFKQFTNVTAAGTGTATKSSTDWFALPAEKEVFGSTTYANATAENSLSQFEWYKTAANRIKKAGAYGEAGYWWERSPHSRYSDVFCRVTDNGKAGFSRSSSGIAPFGCI